MSLVLEALNKAKQQTSGKQAGDAAQLQIMTGGHHAVPSETSRVGVLIGAAVGVVGAMLAIAVVVLGMMLKPAPRAAQAEVAMTVAPIAPVAESPAGPMHHEPILQVQPFLDTLTDGSHDVEPMPASIKIDAPPPIEPAHVEAVAPKRDAPVENAIASAQVPAAAPAPPAVAIAPVPAVPPVPPAASKEPLKAGIEYVQTLDVSDAPPIKLGAVIWSDTLKVALINGATMQTGDGVNGVKLVEIEPKRVKLEYGDKMFWVRLP